MSAEIISMAEARVARRERYEREHPEQVVRTKALFQPIYNELGMMNAELDQLSKAIDNFEGGT